MFFSVLSRDRLCRSQQEKPQKLISSSRRKGSWKMTWIRQCERDIEERCWRNLMVFNGKRMKWQRLCENMPKTRTIAGHHSTGYPSIVLVERPCDRDYSLVLIHLASCNVDTLCGLLSFNKSASVLKLNKRFRMIANNRYNDIINMI